LVDRARDGGWWTRAEAELAALDAISRKSFFVRLICGVALGIVLGLNVDWRVAGIWIAANVLSATCGYFVQGGFGATKIPGEWPARLANTFIGSAIWTSAAVLYWLNGGVALHLASLSLLTALLMLAQGNSFSSRAATIAVGIPPGLAFVLLPTMFSRFSGVELLSVVLSFGLCLLYLAVSVQLNVANARALRQAQEELGREKDAAIAANRAKSAFLAMMSHELRTPMNGVLGMAHALTLTDLNGRQASHVDMLVRSGSGLMSILNDILDISKIEAGKLELEIIAFDLRDLACRVHDLWTESASAKGVRLVCDLPEDGPLWVSGDPTRLRQIMTNLVSNALKFTSEGEVRLSIRRGNAEWWTISVSDTGPGIPEALQAQLFQAFVQTEASITRKFGGTGLGLAICKQLVEMMGGEISVASREGAGSIFSAVLPLPEAAGVAAEDRPVLTCDLAGVRILVADDNAINQAVAAALLEALGATVTPVGDGRAALDALLVQEFDIVLMDVHMPVMGGIEAVGCIRAGEAGPPDRPVIALTADAMAGVDTALMKAGFDDVVSKPVNPTELAAKISNRLMNVGASEATSRDIAAA